MAENERGKVAFCGLFCGDCHLLEGAIARLAGDSHLRNLRKLRNEGMDAFLAGEKYW